MNRYIQRLFVRPEGNYKAIDGIRAIAVIWVIIFHAWVFQFPNFGETTELIFNFPFTNWMAKGGLGVDLFFVISGFLIGTILFKEFKKTNTLNFKKFYVRRFLRLMPVYIFSMIIGAYFLEGTPDGNWGTAWTNLLYINNYVRDSYMGWTWSLAIEEQFYIVIPFLIAFIFPLFKNKFIPFGALAFTTIALSYHYSVNIFDFEVPFSSVPFSDEKADWFWGYYVLTHLRYGGLLSGVIGAYINVFHQEKLVAFLNKNVLRSNIIFLTLLAVIYMISNIAMGQFSLYSSPIFDYIPNNVARIYEIIHRDLFSYAVLFIILCCIHLDSKVVRPVNSFLSSKFFYPIAQVSYSAYLFHEMFMFWFFPIFNEFGADILSDLQIVVLNGLISLVVIVFVATLMYLFVEQPFQDIKERLRFKSKGPLKVEAA